EVPLYVPRPTLRVGNAKARNFARDDKRGARGEGKGRGPRGEGEGRGAHKCRTAADWEYTFSIRPLPSTRLSIGEVFHGKATGSGGAERQHAGGVAGRAGRRTGGSESTR